MFNKLKKWWFNLTHLKCDYCKEPKEYFYEAYLFPVKKWEGVNICIDCVKKLPNQEDIHYG